MRVNADAALESMNDQIQAIMDEVRIDPSEFELPEPVVPGAITNEADQPEPLCDSRRPLDERFVRLLARKGYDQ